jgi:hypothetical protein
MILVLLTAILYKWQHSVFETENKNTMYCIKFKIRNLHSLQKCCSLSYMWGLEILLTCGKHLHDHIISLRGEVWAHKNNLAQPLFIDMHYQLSVINPFFLVRSAHSPNVLAKLSCDEKIDFILIHHLLSNKNNLFLRRFLIRI